jgi:uncharacterized protein (TIGR00290 family)
MAASGRYRAWVAWSSGKDSLWALHLVRQSSDVEVVGLLTTITDDFGRATMHGVRESLVEAQAAALRLPLHRVRVPTPCSQERYEELMAAAMEEAGSLDVSQMVFGDIFLADVRAHRERQLARVGMTALFPLWEANTATLAETMIAAGLRAYITCLDPTKVPVELAGHPFDCELLHRLPENVDPCGENGEFHTFAWGGPGLNSSLAVQVGETVHRDGFVFTDVIASADREAGPG